MLIIYFINIKILLQHIKKLTSYKTNAFHCLYVSTEPVHLTCSMKNHVAMSSLSASLVCCVCSLAGMWMPKLCATVCVNVKFINFTCGKHAGTRVYPVT